MTHSPIRRAPARVSGRSLVLIGLVLGIAACSDTGEFMFGSRDAAAAGPAPIGATRQIERDVEAPEVFDVTDEGLWDGRPSLGGVWVAHAEATDPERVIIRNTETGRFVIGALFRRERENPGPPVQISSDAAAALDILAGAPTTVQVIALRREEAPDTEAPVADVGLADAGAPLADIDGPAPATLPAIAAAALAPAPAAPDVDIASRPLLRPLAAQSVSAAPAIARNMSAEDIMAGIQRAAFSPEALAPASPPAAQPVPAIAAVADAAITESEIATAMLAPLEATPLDTPAPAPTPATAAAPLPDRAYVQIGIFSVQENANATGQTLRNAGLVPTIYDQTSSGRQFWRVVVGPAPTAEDRAAILDTVRGLGFGDAYFVAR
jgi:cell division septation protein DedD